AFCRVGGHQSNLVHPAGLTQAIDPAGALLDPRCAPRQLVMDDEAAMVMKVEALGGGVGGEERDAAVIEAILDLPSCAGFHAAVQHENGPARAGNDSLQPMQCVSILGEEDERFPDSAKKPE